MMRGRKAELQAERTEEGVPQLRDFPDDEGTGVSRGSSAHVIGRVLKHRLDP